MLEKILIVDDELWIRKGLIKNIDWDGLRMELAGEAIDGEDALNKVEASVPDIMLIDMRMPGMDGSELLKKMKTISPETVIIIISGYSDFEYTKEAIVNRAFDYILKPVEKNNLNEVLKKAVLHLDEMARQRLKEDDNKIRKDILSDDVPEIFRSDGSVVIDQIVAFVKENYFNDISLNDLARKYYMNPNYLSRLFKEKQGKNFIDFLTGTRIEKAKQLLTETKYKCQKISKLVGYDDFKYFSQAFKKHTGMPPTLYRRKLTDE